MPKQPTSAAEKARAKKLIEEQKRKMRIAKAKNNLVEPSKEITYGIPDAKKHITVLPKVVITGKKKTDQKPNTVRYGDNAKPLSEDQIKGRAGEKAYDARKKKAAAALETENKKYETEQAAKTSKKKSGTKTYADLDPAIRDKARAWNMKTYGTHNPTAAAKKAGISKAELAKQHKAGPKKPAAVPPATKVEEPKAEVSAPKEKPTTASMVTQEQEDELDRQDAAETERVGRTSDKADRILDRSEKRQDRVLKRGARTQARRSKRNEKVENRAKKRETKRGDRKAISNMRKQSASDLKTIKRYQSAGEITSPLVGKKEVNQNLNIPLRLRRVNTENIVKNPTLSNSDAARISTNPNYPSPVLPENQNKNTGLKKVLPRVRKVRKQRRR